MIVCVYIVRLTQGTDADDEYMISDANLLVSKYVSVPRDMGHLNCGAYVAGIVKVRYQIAEGVSLHLSLMCMHVHVPIHSAMSPQSLCLSR